MQCLDFSQINGQLVVDVAVFPSMIAAQQFRDGRGSAEPIRGLIDTGARFSFVSAAIVAQVGLSALGTGQIYGVTGPSHTNYYAFALAFMSPSLPSRAPSLLYCFPKRLIGFELGHNPRFDVLIGMDVISQAVLIVLPNGKFSLSF